MKFNRASFLLLSAGLVSLMQPALSAADFNFTSGTISLAQTLGNGESGTVGSGATLSLSGSTVDVLMSGTSSLTVNGILRQTGSGRAIDNSSANSVLTVVNTGTISSVSTDAFRVNSNAQVTLTNSGTISVSAGGQAIDWAAITSKSNILNNLSGGVISAVGEDAVRPGTNGQVNNAGSIMATVTGGANPSGSDGIDLRTFSGITVTNTGTISGRHGIATDGGNEGPFTFTVNNNAGSISAVNGSGLNIDGANSTVTATVNNAFGATFQGGVLAAAADGDGDGIDVDGVLTLDNAGDILSGGAKGSNNPEGIAMGGGTIINRQTGRIIGSSLAADAPNGDSSKIGSGILVDDSNGGNAVAATSITNSGLIQGKSGFGVKIIGTFDNSVTNNSTGTIRGAGNAGTVGAALQTGNGNDTVTNAGTITGDNGKAVNLQGGNDILNITGGTISGDIDGGTGTNTINVNAGSNTASTNGSITNFSSSNVQSGRWNLSGSINSGAAISITGGVLNYTGVGALGNTVTVNGGEFKNNGGNFTGTLNFVSGTVSGSNLSGVALTIGADRVLSPGNSPGTMETGSQTWASDGTYLWEINALADDGGTQGSDPGWDFADITGTLDITATSSGKFTIDIDSLNVLSSWDNSQDYTFVLATASGGINGFDADAFTLASSAFADQNSLAGGHFSIEKNGNSIELKYSAVPEPATWAMFILGTGFLIFVSRSAFPFRSRKG